MQTTLSATTAIGSVPNNELSSMHSNFYNQLARNLLVSVREQSC